MFRAVHFFVLVSLGLAAASISAQTTSSSNELQGAVLPKLSYDVASIHASSDDIRGYTVRSKDPAHEATLDAENLSATNLVTNAYGVNYYQLEGAPDWASKARYVIHAKSEGGSTEALKKLSDDQAKQVKEEMFRELLADRFRLKVHIIMKEQPVYKLVIAKGGLKIKPASEESKKPKRTYQYRCSRQGCDGQWDGTTMDLLRSVLEGQCGAKVINETGLAGKYDVTLRWSGTPQSESPSDGNADSPTLLTAVQEQLGLKLEPARGPVPVVVVDHMEKPSEN